MEFDKEEQEEQKILDDINKTDDVQLRFRRAALRGQMRIQSISSIWFIAVFAGFVIALRWKVYADEPYWFHIFVLISFCYSWIAWCYTRREFAMYSIIKKLQKRIEELSRQS